METNEKLEQLYLLYQEKKRVEIEKQQLIEDIIPKSVKVKLAELEEEVTPVLDKIQDAIDILDAELIFLQRRETK